MPLGKLTDPEPMFNLLGRLKKGAPKGAKGQVGKDLDYWRPVFLKNKDRERIEERFKEVYGEQPKEINIRLAFDTISENWDANLECFKGGVMVAKCGMTEEKGYYWIYYRDPYTHEVLVRDCLPVGENGQLFIQKPIDPEAPIYETEKNKYCMEPTGRLRVVIPEIAMMDPPVVGWFEVTLKSPTDIRQVSGELKTISKRAQDSNSPLYGIPMRLSRIEQDITKHIGDNLTRGPSWMVHIELQGQWASQNLLYVEKQALPLLEAEIVDEEEGTLEPWEEQPQVEQEVTHQESKTSPRLRNPEQLKDEFDRLCQHHREKKTPVYEKGFQVIAKALGVVFPDDTDRYAFAGWITGKPSGSTKKLKPYEVQAFASLMDIEVSGKQGFNQLPSATFTKEAHAALDFANALKGQKELI